MSGNRKSETDFDYDVCLSFAGEDRDYVGQVAASLQAAGVRVFYDKYEEVGLWGKDLFEHLDDVYRYAARYCVLFASQHYATKMWTTHERKSAQARAIEANEEYILPACFDDTDIPGMRSTIGRIDLKDRSPQDLASLIRRKVGAPQRSLYLPPNPDVLFERLAIDNDDDKALVHSQASRFLHVLSRMTDDERKVVFGVFRIGCAEELPENMHVNLDLLRRELEFPVSKIERIVGRLQSLGFFANIRVDDETPDHLGKQNMLVVEWHNMNGGDDGGNGTAVAHEMLFAATEGYCDEHGLEALQRLDFSQLATVTKTDDGGTPP